MDPSLCRMTRAELNQLLEKSQFGSIETIYNEYFFRGKMNETLCKTCSMQIQQHGDGAVAESTVVQMGIPMTNTTSANTPLLSTLGTGYPKGVDFSRGPVSTVSCLTTSRPYLIAGTIELFLGILILVLFIALGVAKVSSGYALITPSILIFLGLVLLLVPRAVVVTVDKNGNTVTAVTKHPFGCCASPITVRVEDITNVTTDEMRRSMGQRTLFSIHAVTANHTKIELERVIGGLLDVTVEAQKWQNLVEDMKSRRVA